MGCDNAYPKMLSGRYKFQSTHPSWGATACTRDIALSKVISIHAPIVGCDQTMFYLNHHLGIISIHAPIVGCDYIKNIIKL